MAKPLLPPNYLLWPVLACWLPAAAVGAAPRLAHARPAAARAHPTAPITGRVLDEKGEGLPGVTVRVRNGTQGTSTDISGNFTLDVPAGTVLIISAVGYATQTIPLTDQTTLSVQLVPDVQNLSEAVVVGYLTQERQNVTGSVATVSGANVQRAPVASVGEAIQGRLAGVQVANSGSPGQAPVVNIRGLGTLGGTNSSPLYVVDGLWLEPTSSAGRDINPADIESVQVLKDAASLAPYGNSGANGVIVITTRKGRQGVPAITFNAKGGVQNLVHRLDLADAAQWAAINNQAYDNAGLLRQAYAATLPGTNTKWQDEFFRQGSVQDYNLGFSGGGPNSNFNVTGGYFNQKGTVVGPEFERYTMRVNTGFNRGRLRVGENLQLVRANQTRLNAPAVNGSPFTNIVRLPPVVPVYDPTQPGGYGIGTNNAVTFGTNPLALQDLLNDTGTSNRVLGNVYGEVQLFDFLRYRLNLGLEYHGFHDQQRRKYGVWRRNDVLNPSYFAEDQGNELFTQAENTLTYDQSFGDHNLTVVGGYSRQRRQYEYTGGVNYGYGTGPVYYWALDAGNQTPQVIGSSYVQGKESFFAQLSYDYNQRFLVTGAFRRDGSSLFAADRKWGNFGAASVGWRLSKEKFLADIKLISDLKLRASYGSLGNQYLSGAYGGSYISQGFINTNANYALGANQAVQNGAIQTTLASNVKWEERRTQNYGLDLALLESRFSLSADYYISRTYDALIQPNLPATAGNAGDLPYQNLGQLENRGFEFQLGYADDRKPFKYGITANLTTLRNKVLSLNSGAQEGTTANFLTGGPGNITRTEVGYEVGSFYLYPFDGVYQTGEANIPAGLSPGDVRYSDTNGDGTIDDRDRIHAGRVFPKIQYGLNLTASYANFDVAIFFQGVQGNTVFNDTRYWLDRSDENGNYRADYSPWTPDNPSTTTPRAIIAGGGGIAAGYNARYNSTRWLESGSYLRLKNVQLGYSLPKDLLTRSKYVASLRVVLTGQNVFTVTNYSGFDPETVGLGALARGADVGSYPNLRSFTLGIQAGF
ncbi:SusC/RagA family TonB-linked outer membrane protein [Hymenobacter bucti]|uniref:SusC/RagA family TonB-linked outer membrane protein n=1 Tax=Hymenobacter bucti TaxID=1844114 RepID=A0ABW4QTZ7_9BACT